MGLDSGPLRAGLGPVTKKISGGRAKFFYTSEGLDSQFQGEVVLVWKG
jgi:hypothetical protein